jgi:hypothetical protein
MAKRFCSTGIPGLETAGTARNDEREVAAKAGARVIESPRVQRRGKYPKAPKASIETAIRGRRDRPVLSDNFSKNHKKYCF